VSDILVEYRRKGDSSVLHTLRLASKTTIHDAAESIAKTSVFISAIESGRERVPVSVFVNLTRFYSYRIREQFPWGGSV
jgi:hypothetical protein